MPRTKNRKRNSRNNRNRGSRMQPTVVRNIVTQKIYTQTLRFRANAALTSTQIYRRDLFNLIWMSTGIALGNTVVSSFRVNRIEMVAVATGGAVLELNTIAFEWSGGSLGLTKEIVAEGTSALPGRIVSRPPRNSVASFWLSNASTTPGLGDTMFILSSLSTGVTIDLSFSYILMDGNENSLALTTAGATAGFIYTNSLDNSSSGGAMAASKLLPVGRVFLQAWG